MSPDDTILVAPHPSLPGVATFTLNRPMALNSLDEAMTKAFVPAIQKIAADASIRVLIVQGAGEHFMAGGDIKGFAGTLENAGPERQAHFRDMIHYLHGGIELMQRMPIITVAKVRGACAGFGMSLAIGCDLTIASDDAYFATAYKAIGLTPDGGQSYFLPRLVGMKKAMELTLLSERIKADEAERLGFVNKVGPLAELDAHVDKIAQQIARSARGSMAGAKRLVNTSLSNTMSEQLIAEGIRAFIEKRHAKFS
jgi:2-(1,2-epoxy-1,2-dihydrophenyl)acetyl-CoA isomerase